jgi:pyrimidine operon attenuation protein/uracil phosphoribosyltransferase
MAPGPLTHLTPAQGTPSAPPEAIAPVPAGALGEVADAERLRRILVHIAKKVVECTPSVDRLALVGIGARGQVLAGRIQAAIFQAEGVRVALGTLDPRLYRDDLFDPLAPRTSDPIFDGAAPEGPGTHLPFDLATHRVVLVDDVINSGRTIFAALRAVYDWGRPLQVSLAVLVDRGFRVLPVRADVVGMPLTTLPTDRVLVRLNDLDGDEGVYLIARGGRP